MFLFHSDARSFIGQYERGGSSPPFYIGLRTTRWLKFIGDKPNYTAGEKKRKEETPSSFSRIFFSPVDGTIRWNDDFNEKRGKNRLLSVFVHRSRKRYVGWSYVRRLGFSIFQLLELGCTRTYAKLAFAERRKLAEYDVRTIVLGRESPPQLELRWFRRRKL